MDRVSSLTRGELFSFASVPVQATQTRILLLFPAPDPHHPIRGRLEAIELADGPALSSQRFTALSYAWGNVAEVTTMEMNGRPMNITTTLAAALRTLRRANETRVLWVDQTCINQADAVEKAVHIPLMRKIYSISEKTVAWLGLPTDETDRAMDYLNDVGEKGHKIGVCKLSFGELQGVVNGPSPGPTIDRARSLDRTPEKTKGDPLDDDKNIAMQVRKGRSVRAMIDKIIQEQGESYHLDIFPDLEFLFRLPYWTRGWVKQEILIPERVVFQCGNKTIDIDTLHSGIKFSHIFYKIHQSYAAKPRKRLLLDVRINRLLDRRERKGHRASLRYVLQWLQTDTKFSDPRDRIYGMLALVPEENQLGIMPDYTLPWEEVYIDAARRILDSGAINFLSMVRLPKSSAALPTWVPDLTTVREHMLIDLRTWYSDDQFKANLDTKHIKVAVSPQMELEDASEKLYRVRGIRIDEVVKVGSCYEHPPGVPWQEISPLPTLSDLAQFVTDAENSLDRSHPFSSNIALYEQAAWRAPVLDHETHTKTAIRSQRATKKNTLEAYHKYIKLLKEHTGLDAEGNPTLLPPSSIDSLVDEQVSGFIDHMSWMRHRRPYVGKGGYIGIGPKFMAPGDLICVLYGAFVPFVLRPVRRDGKERYEVVGECYCDGIMDGEALERLEEPEAHIFVLG